MLNTQFMQNGRLLGTDVVRKLRAILGQILSSQRPFMSPLRPVRLLLSHFDKCPGPMRWSGVGVLLVALVACGAKDAPPAGGAAGKAPPPATVGVVTVAEQAVALQTELPGRVSPARVAQVRARVSGVVLKRLFREGSEANIEQTRAQWQLRRADELPTVNAGIGGSRTSNASGASPEPIPQG